MTYEEMQILHDDLNIVEMDLSEVSGLKGLYVNGRIAINAKMSDTEKACVLAEELGHHYTTYGNILDQSNTSNQKQELRARAWAYNKQIGLLGLIRAYEHGCRNRFEIAEYLEVTEEVLEECISYYRKKYGIYQSVDNYIIYFVPTLTVFKRI